MEIYKKLLKARDSIKNTKIEKKGENKFSNYKYFTPSQISDLVHDACKETGLICLYLLEKSDTGYTAILNVFNTEKPEEHLVFSIPTAVPEIKATNEAQKIGGTVTYSERYLKMIVFDITDNSLDFDTTENTEKQAKKELKEVKSEYPTIPKLSDKFYENWGKSAYPYTILDEKFVELAGKRYLLSEAQIRDCNIYVEQMQDLYALEELKKNNIADVEQM